VPIEGKYFGKMETADIVVETDKVDGLSRFLRRTYYFWATGGDCRAVFSATTFKRHRKASQAALGVDIGMRRPAKESQLELRKVVIFGNFAPPPAFVADAPELLFRRAARPPPIQAGGVDPPAGVAGGHDSVPGHLSSRPPALSRCPDDFAGSAETGR